VRFAVLRVVPFFFAVFLPVAAFAVALLDVFLLAALVVVRLRAAGEERSADACDQIGVGAGSGLIGRGTGIGSHMPGPPTPAWVRSSTIDMGSTP